MSEQNYQPPKVWEWKQNSGGAFANINRPVSGATHERVLPVGTHPLQLYSLGTPNGQKVTIMLEDKDTHVIAESLSLTSKIVSNYRYVACRKIGAGKLTDLLIIKDHLKDDYAR